MRASLHFAVLERPDPAVDIVCPDAEAPLLAADEVGVELCDAKVVDRFPVASIADPLQDNEAAIFTIEFIADLQVILNKDSEEYLGG